MFGRSFEPSSYLASASHFNDPNRTARPSFRKMNTSSSILSTPSDDSLTAGLKGLSTEDKENLRDDGGEADTADDNPVSNSPQTPGRKKSDPIAIELPSRSRVPPIYTPLTARGDLKGGYFPEHEDPKEPTDSYRPHPYNHDSDVKFEQELLTMSTSTSLYPSQSDRTSNTLTPVLSPLSPSVPAALIMPLGKYHPANYKSPCSTSVSSPVSIPKGAILPPANIAIPSLPGKPEVKNRPSTHATRASDVKKKLQQYQRDMIRQARMAALKSTGHDFKAKAEPISPRLLPAGSPGPITPFELDMEEDGYLGAGYRASGGSSAVSMGFENKREPRKGSDASSYLPRG